MFRNIEEAFPTGGIAVFGDLMFENDEERNIFLDTYRKFGPEKWARDIEGEFFWNVESTVSTL